MIWNTTSFSCKWVERKWIWCWNSCFDDNSEIDNEKLMAFEGNIRVVEAHACGTSQRIILYHVCCSKTYNVWKSSNLSMHGLNLTMLKSKECGSRLI